MIKNKSKKDALMSSDGIQQSYILELRNNFLKSQWPKCNALADEILKIGVKDAIEIFLAASKAHPHHVRSAAINALVKIGDLSVVPHIEKHLADRAYEVRMDAKEAIRVLTGKEVKTAKGE